MSPFSKTWFRYAFALALWACTVGWLVVGVVPLGNIVKFHAWFFAVLWVVALLFVLGGKDHPKRPACGKFEYSYMWFFRNSRLLFLVWYGQFFYAGLLIFCVAAAAIVFRNAGDKSEAGGGAGV